MRDGHRPTMGRGRGILPQQALPLRALARLACDFQQRLGVVLQVIRHCLGQPQSAAYLIPLVISLASSSISPSDTSRMMRARSGSTPAVSRIVR